MNLKLKLIGILTLSVFVEGCSSQPRNAKRELAASGPGIEFVPSIVVNQGKTDKQYEAAVLSLLDSAKKSIDVIQFEFASETGFVLSLADKLISLQKKNPKMKIRVILEK